MIGSLELIAFCDEIIGYHRWADEGATALQQRANQKVREIIEHHRAEPLPESVVERTKAVIGDQ